MIEALLGQQLGVGTLFDDRAVVDDQNLVRIADRTQAMIDILDVVGQPAHQVAVGAGVKKAQRK